jgi:4-hydroxybenzoate polyprenyltransferase
MKAILAYFRIVRWFNLLFIALTQFLFYQFVYGSLNQVYDHPLSNMLYLLMFSSMLIAGGGYIINDYFDVQIDRVNKPNKVFIDQAIKRRWAIFWHALMSFAGLIISAFISKKTGIWTILIGNAGCVFLLWYYSTHLKKKLLWGNLAISLLTSWTIGVIYFFSGGRIFNYNYHFRYNINQYVKLVLLYSGFAFMLTLVREVVKDLEDISGDEQYGCKTMPIRWGIPASKIFAGVWLFVAASGLSVMAFYLIQKGLLWPGLYTLFALVFPIVWITKKLKASQKSSDFHQISNMLKVVMLAGILSMLFF